MLHFTEGLFALPFHVLSHENKRAGPAHMEFSMCEIRSQELADFPEFLFKPRYLVGIKFVLVRYPNT